MPLPNWLAKVNRSFTNKILGRIPRRISPFVILYHVGRSSGRSYSTPLAAFRTESGYVLTPTYGPKADWVRNVLASPDFSMDRRGKMVDLTNPRLAGRPEVWPYLPVLIRIAMRAMGVKSFVLADKRGSGVAEGDRLDSDLL